MPASRSALLAAHHRDLDDVGRGALDHGVDGEPLAEAARVRVAGAQLGDRAAAAQQRGDEALLLRPLDHLLAEGAHGGEALQVAGDEFLALFARDVEPVGEAEAGEAVDDAEVDHLRLRALADVDVVAGDVEDLGRGRRVDVVAGAEDLFQHLLVGDVGEHPQLDLAVVGGEQLGALLGDEAGPHRAADLGADRDVLQVGVGAGEAAGGGRRLVEGGVDAAGLGVDQVRQRVEVGVLQLGQLAPGLDLLDDRVLVADLGEDAGVGREAGFAAPLAGQAELLEEDAADLLRRADRELLLGQLEDLLLQRLDPLAEAGADLGQALGVELQPLAFHRREDVDQRQLDLAQQVLEAELLDAGALDVGESGDQARFLGRLETGLAVAVERELAVVLVLRRRQPRRQGRSPRRRRARSARRCAAAARAGRRRASCRGRAPARPPRAPPRRAGRGGRRRAT